MDRKQRVGINMSLLFWEAVTSMMPQCSVLGPQLYTFYINNLDVPSKCNISTLRMIIVLAWVIKRIQRGFRGREIN